MTTDEMKNRISMELKNPLTQQMFEIICKENAELKKHKRECETSICAAEYQSMREKFSKARALLEQWAQTSFAGACDNVNLAAETEQFLAGDL